jgi:hypothetical protein
MHLFGKREGERTSHCFDVFVNREGDAENRRYEKKNWEASGTNVPVHHAAVDKLIPARGEYGKVVDYAVAVAVALAWLVGVDARVAGGVGAALRIRTLLGIALATPVFVVRLAPATFQALAKRSNAGGKRYVRTGKARYLLLLVVFCEGGDKRFFDRQKSQRCAASASLQDDETEGTVWETHRRNRHILPT